MRLLVDSMKRAIWRNNTALAFKLIDSSDIARSLLAVSEGPDGIRVCCTDSSFELLLWLLSAVVPGITGYFLGIDSY